MNYYGIVRPQTQFANSITALQNQVNQVNPFAAASSEQALATGHPFGFQNYRYYFQNQNFAGGYGAGVGSGYGTSGFGRPGFGTGGQPGSGPGSQQLGVPAPRHR
ncbi:hypothetical protein J0H58_35440 [bacterium]|nr:hypothetical protein [bacterium]